MEIFPTLDRKIGQTSWWGAGFSLGILVWWYLCCGWHIVLCSIRILLQRLEGKQGDFSHLDCVTIKHKQLWHELVRIPENLRPQLLIGMDNESLGFCFLYLGLGLISQEQLCPPKNVNRIFSEFQLCLWLEKGPSQSIGVLIIYFNDNDIDVILTGPNQVKKPWPMS